MSDSKKQTIQYDVNQETAQRCAGAIEDLAQDALIPVMPRIQSYIDRAKGAGYILTLEVSVIMDPVVPLIEFVTSDHRKSAA